MKLTCPACNALFTLDAALQGDAAREAVLTALALPAPLAKLLVRYLTCFAPAKRQLSWERVATLLGELAGPIAEAKIERNGRTWSAPMGYWQMGLETVLQARDGGKLTLPLKSHGYLFEVIAGLSGKAEALAESADHQRRAGTVPIGTHASHTVVTPPVVTDRVPLPDSLKQFVRRKPAGGNNEQ